MTNELTDAEYIRALKRDGSPASVKEIADHNDRLEKIAAYEPTLTEAQMADKARLEGMQRAINLTCTYCADGREIIDRGDSGMWHFVARGGDLGDTEPCTAHKLHCALQSRKTDGVG